ncbi:Aste57867_9914 [Aphanomyces stellatus]|uniref:Aste57867_9914 protein n=1 Tax=Aphanomyces stellatus TaxID=120398 RepID=A0A485KPP7_9STRA|nr:hypothetical protein As57867_009875 [Aphanomyces stellatus]VFT86792.1 Aste57867_9914 [Aphanomyces stellatus]
MVLAAPDVLVDASRIPISSAAAVVHVMTKRVSHASNVDLYCLLFNAQGQLVDHMAHHTASRDGSIVQETRNQYGHDQKYVVSLSRVNFGVDVIGFILSHSEDTISDATKPLDACSVSCVLHMSPVDEILAQGQGELLCEDTYSPERGIFRNALMVCKMYRDSRQRSHWIFNPICEGMQCASHCIVGLTRCAQMHLLDIIQDIDIPNVASLNSIQGICSALSSVEFLAFENMFPVDGFDKQAFAMCLCEGMVHSRPELRSEKRLVALLSLLYEMFDQIDINGDCHVDWEEFTSFCVSLGMISTKQSKLGDGGVEYIYKQHACYGPKYVNDDRSTFPYHITRFKCFDVLKKVAVLEYMSPLISIYDFDGHFLHDMTGIAKSSVMKDGLYVIDLDHVPAKNCFVVSSSDRSITIWSIVNAVKGQYVQSGKIINHDMMMVVKWVPMLKLCMTSCVKTATLWNVEKCKAEHKLTFHSDIVTDIVELPGTHMFATSSYDHNVAIWEADRMKVVFEFTGHTQAVLHMDCIGNVLVSAGFEHHARVWNIATRKHLVTLTGHHHALLDVKLFRTHSTSLFCVTGDASGHFKVWDVSRCIVDASRDAAIVLHTYTITVTGSMAPLYHSFTIIPERKRNMELLDIWAGNFNVMRLIPEMVASLHSPLQFVLYNQVSHSFTASVAGRITVWSGKSGSIIQEPINITHAEVCGLCFDLPRQRKLFIATSDGHIAMYNPITGLQMDSVQLHDGEILSMIYCERTNCIISNGSCDSISICCDVQGQGRLDPIRAIKNVHRAHMSSSAYSSEHGLVATGDAAGTILVHDFQRLALVFRCEGHKGEVSALAFHKQTCVLFAGDTAGEVYVWQVLNVAAVSRVVMKLSYTAASPSLSTTFVTSSSSPPVVCGINALCVTEDTDHSFASIVAGDDLGNVHCWPLASIRQHTRGAMKIHFEPLPDSMIAYARGGYNPNHRGGGGGAARRSTVALPPQYAALEPEKKAARVAKKQGRTSSPRVDETISWKAHDGKIVHVHPLQFPGFFFSTDDGGVRLWDAQGECLGTLQRKYDEAGENETLQWQYRSSILIADNSATMKAMASRILDRLAQHEEVILSEYVIFIVIVDMRCHDDRPGDATDAMAGQDDQDITGYLDALTPRALRRHKSLAHVVTKTKASKAIDPGLDAAMLTVQAKAMEDQAFSRQSLQNGVKESVFTQEESALLECVGRDSHLRQNYDTILFPPLLLTTLGIKKKFVKDFVKVTTDDVEDLPILRTCDHFADEVAIRRLKKQSFRREKNVLSIEPSAFLAAQLDFKSPPVKKGNGKVHIVLDGVVHQSIAAVALPQLPSPMVAPPRPPLRSSVSMPSLGLGPRDDVNDETDDDEADEEEGDDAAASPAVLSCETKDVSAAVKRNIERKLTLCASMRHDQPRRRTLANVGNKMAKKTKQRIDPVEWVKMGKNPFGPHYSVREVLEFGETLLRFDKDLSGDIDRDEWMKIMTAFMPKTQETDLAVAKELFATVDANEDGIISHNELLHIVFLQATKDQLLLMEELIKRSSHGPHADGDSDQAPVAIEASDAFEGH